MRLRFDARTRRILRRLPVVNVYSLAELVLIGGLAIQSARLLPAGVTSRATAVTRPSRLVVVPAFSSNMLAARTTCAFSLDEVLASTEIPFGRLGA